MSDRGKHDTLPPPDRLHHMVEDFLAMWDTPLTHILPLRRFLETCIQKDMRCGVRILFSVNSLSATFLKIHLEMEWVDLYQLL